MSERPTFSPFWHRVRAMTPRLRPHVQITRQHYRAQRWHVVHDPASNQFYRLSPIAHEYVALLDGKRSVEEVWEMSLAKHADDAPTQNDIIQLLSQLYNANLLSIDASPETEQLLSRGRERIKKRIQQQAIGLMYFKLRLFNPDAYLSWLEPVLRPLINVWGFIAWALLVLFAFASIVPHWQSLATGFEDAVAPSNWGWMIVVFIITKFIHETGHGVICKRFGGQVPEFGVMLLVLLPAPYVDASSCWAFESKYRRMAVGAGGMIFELTVAAIAALVWVNIDPGLPRQLAYNAMLTASVSTVLFNANPLMRFDGYYILSDLLEIPNLMQRSNGMLKYLVQKYIYRIKDPHLPSTIPAEQSILVGFGIAAMAYRLFLFVSITLYVMGQLFAVGLILAVWTAAMWFILPIGGFVNWLATNNQLSEFRARAVLTSLALIAAGVLAIGVIPWPDHRRGVGVVESTARAGVYFGVEGFVTKVHARPGTAVAKGEPIVTLMSRDLEAQVATAAAMLEEAEAQERQSTTKSQAAAQVARDRVETLREQILILNDKVTKLVVRAPFDGIVVGSDPDLLLGAYVKEGQQLCEVVDARSLRVAATMTQDESSWLNTLGPDQYTVEMRLRSQVERVFEGTNVRVVPAGQRELPHAALGFSGGGTIETEQKDQHGTIAKNAQFKVYIDPKAGLDKLPSAPGERVALRFTLESKPLIVQWVDRLHKLIQGRVHI